MVLCSFIQRKEKKQASEVKKKKEGKKKGLKGGRGERGEAEPPPPPNPCSAAQPLAARNAGPGHASDVHSPAGDSDMPVGSDSSSLAEGASGANVVPWSSSPWVITCPQSHGKLVNGGSPRQRGTRSGGSPSLRKHRSHSEGQSSPFSRSSVGCGRLHF